jgi:serine/threonine protein kinase
MREREERALQPGAATEPEISTALLPPEPDLTGQQFGTYRVGRKLTESFWDKVYEAEQLSIGRSVVLHVLRSSLREIPERAQEFLDAASVNANIRHPAILRSTKRGNIRAPISMRANSSLGGPFTKSKPADLNDYRNDRAQHRARDRRRAGPSRTITGSCTRPSAFPASSLRLTMRRN